MLVIKRRRNERIMIGEEIIIEVIRTGKDSVRLGITAPPDVPVNREEVYKTMKKAIEGRK